MFAALGTQWNIGQGGVIGLRYEAIIPVMKLMGVRKKDRAQMLQDLRAMESEAIQVLNKR